MHRVIWSNGKVDEARTWTGLLDQIREDQWRGYTDWEFRAEMAKRAWRWSRTSIDMGASPRRFFHELERAKLIIIDRPYEGQKEGS